MWFNWLILGLSIFAGISQPQSNSIYGKGQNWSVKGSNKIREQHFGVETEAAFEVLPWYHQFSSPQNEYYCTCKIPVLKLHVTVLDCENDKAAGVSGAYWQHTNEYKRK